MIDEAVSTVLRAAPEFADRYLKLVEAADVSELVVERELLAVLVAADVVLAVVLAALDATWTTGTGTAV